MDIIELALDQLTDFIKFEKLANEVVALQGYPTVRIIAGIDDEGIDAELNKYYEDAPQKTTIFQYSLQKNVSTKIIDTIDKLLENEVNFNELVLVTPVLINNVGTYRTKVREKYNNKIKLDVIERKTFVTTLSKEQQIFYRYFPDIKKQLESSLFDKKSIFTDSSDSTLNESLLKCSLLFTFNPQAQKQRKSLFDNTILAIIFEKKISTIQDVKQIFESEFDKFTPEEQIKAAIHRLEKIKLIQRKDKNQYELTKNAIEKIGGNIASINAGTEALIIEICAKATLLYNNKVSIQEQNILEKNVRKALSGFFRLYGLDYYHSLNNKLNTSLFIHWDIKDESDLIKIAKSDLPTRLGEVLVYSLGDVLKKPTDEQTKILVGWSKAFIGVQIMGLDPMLKDFQVKKIAEKTFILDTDFVLYCIVDNCPVSTIYKKILEILIDIGCRIILPEAIVHELIKHAEYSTRSYNYFRNTFDKSIIEDKIPNIFVKDFYHAIQDKSLDISFKSYMSNFLDQDAPYEFMRDVLDEKLPTSITILEAKSLLADEFSPDILEKLTTEIYNETIKTFKAQSRSEEENRLIAHNDANLYLTSYYLTKELSKNKKEILTGDYYLVTASTRAIRCAKKLNIYGDVIVKPQTLIELFENVGLFSPSPKDIISLFDNPFLVNVVNENWNQLKKLIDSGVDLKGKNIVRLKWDLEKSIHKYFTNEEKNSSKNQEKRINTEEYPEFVKSLKSKGYHFIPEVEHIIQKFEKLEATNRETNKINEELTKAIKKFGRRKQNYLNKINKKQ